MDLTPEYTVTRYPDAANGVLAQLYNKRLAEEHLLKAKIIIDCCEQLLTEK